MQNAAWVTSVTLMSAIALVFVWVAASTRRPADYGPIVVAAYRLRKVLFLALAAVIVVANVTTVQYLPYAHASGSAPQRIEAVGLQWQWTLSAHEVEAGRPVEFHVKASDVTHGFAIYDANLNLVTQTQAMPGYTNVLHHTFAEAGLYRVLCLEYCGVGHHAMMAELTVR